MANKKRGKFSAAMSNRNETQADALPSKDLLGERMEAVSDSQEIVRTVTRTVDPNDCIPYEDHDRVNENITYEDLRWLTDDLIAQNEGHNHIPAEVRPIENRKPNGPRYEIVSGLRRWLAIKWLRENNYPHFKYLIKIAPMTDEEAFRFSDLENLQKKDIAPYSRAVKYKKGLAKHYHNSQAELAKRLNRSKGWFSQYLRLADLPDEVVKAYASIHDLKVHHAPPILKLLEGKGTKAALIKTAESLSNTHAERAANHEEPMSGSAVLKALLESGKAPKKQKRGPISTYGNFGKGPLISIDAKNADRVKITLSLGSGASKADAVNAFKQALEDHYD